MRRNTARKSFDNENNYQHRNGSPLRVSPTKKHNNNEDITPDMCHQNSPLATRDTNKRGVLDRVE
jgi:hypothetical protein